MADIFVIGFKGKDAVKGWPKADRQLPKYSLDNYIDVFEWKWSIGHGAGESGDMKSGMRTGQKAGGQADVSAFTFKKFVDPSSPKLVENCFTGVEFDEAEFRCYRMVNNIQLYFSIWMGNGVISEVTPGELTNENRLIETVRITMTKFKAEYTPYSDKGEPGTSIAKAYDILNHAPKY